MICLGSLCAMTAILALVLYINRERVDHLTGPGVRVEEEESETPDPLDIKGEYTGDGLTSDDLDFWHMYDEAPQENNSKKRRPDKNLRTVSDNRQKADESVSADEARGVDGLEGDGKTFNCADGGEEELLEIDGSIPANTYSPEGFRQEGNELQYYYANRKVSTYGVDLSAYQGKVDWERLAASGIDFAMIRMGVRGYMSGAVVYDEEFENNIKGANANGINAGLYFLSRAISVQEAEEEANYAVASAAANNVTYPIVYYVEEGAEGSSRSDSLSPDERTALARCFCDKVSSYGYKAMIGGSKHTLSVKFDPALLADYDVWLVDAPYVESGNNLKMSEYPYQYTMWQYSSNARIDGIEGTADLDICFVDYRYR